MSTRPPLPSQSEPSAGDLDAVRQLLFGAELKRFDEARRALEAQMRDAVSALQRETARSLEDLRGALDKRLEEITGQIAALDADLRRELREQSDERVVAESKRLSGEIAALAHSALDRKAAAQIFSDLARALGSDG